MKKRSFAAMFVSSIPLSLVFADEGATNCEKGDMSTNGEAVWPERKMEVGGYGE